MRTLPVCGSLLLASAVAIGFGSTAAPAHAVRPAAPFLDGVSIRRSAPVPRSRLVRPSRSVRRVRGAVSPRPVPATSPAAADVWARLRQCESGGRYDINTGNGFSGAYQFLPSTWRALGFAGLPHQAPPDVQDAAARRLQARSGWGQWPACARKLGLR